MNDKTIIFQERFDRRGHRFCEDAEGLHWIESESQDLIVEPVTKVRPWMTNTGDRWATMWEISVTRSNGERAFTCINETERVALVSRGWISEEIEEPEPQLADLVMDDIAALLLQGFDADSKQVLLDSIRRGITTISEGLQDGEVDMRLRTLCESLSKIGRIS